MVKVHRKIYTDSDLWNQFQMLYPRQASSMIEEWMSIMISRKVGDVADDTEMVDIMEKLEAKKKMMQETSTELQALQAKVQQHQIEKRKAAAIEKQKQKESLERGMREIRAVRASGILGRINI